MRTKRQRETFALKSPFFPLGSCAQAVFLGFKEYTFFFLSFKVLEDLCDNSQVN